MTTELKVLGTKKEVYVGDFVSQTQEMGTNDGFKNVSKSWLSQCLSYDKVLEKCKKSAENIEDIRGGLTQWKPISDNGRFLLENRNTGVQYSLTQHAIQNLCYHANISSTTIMEFTRPKFHTTKVDKDGNKKVIYNRDSRDSDLLVKIFENTLFASDRTDQKKPRLFRTWKNENSIRAILSDRYATVNNFWVLETFCKLIPGGVFSHWRSDADSLRGNILIPQTIRQDQESDFGGMISLGNSEIGTQPVSSLASVFRACCMNGCLYNLEEGIAINKRHIGKIDLNDLRKKMKENLEKQIPLIPNLIDRFLATRTLKIGNIPLINVFVQLANDFSFSRKDLVGMLGEFNTEKQILGNDVFTNYGIINSLTRYSQKLTDDQWVEVDKIAGSLIFEQNTWSKFLNRATNLDKKILDKFVSVSA